MNNYTPIAFDNTAEAFVYKTDSALKKAKFLFSIMGKPWMVKTALAITPIAIKLRIPFTNTIIRKTIFEQFIGGETLEETAPVAEMLGKYSVQVILDYGVEGGNDGEAGFEQSTQQFIKVINYAATQKNIPFMSVKVTGISRLGLLEKIDQTISQIIGNSLMSRYEEALGLLSAEEKAEWERVIERMQRICAAGAQHNIGVLIDAEETWIQHPVDVVTMLMMDKINRGKAIVFNTVQLYRHDRYMFLVDSIKSAKERGFILGIKLVRGAYMEKERERAAKLNYRSPIHPDKQLCDRDYNEAIHKCFDFLEHVSMIVASHNEESNQLAAKLVDVYKLPHNHPHVHFSQLFGMSDHITFNLAKAGFSVSKYLPFGPIKDVVPYLMRRAEENSSVSGQTGRELSLIHQEIKRRGI